MEKLFPHNQVWEYQKVFRKMFHKDWRYKKGIQNFSSAPYFELQVPAMYKNIFEFCLELLLQKIKNLPELSKKDMSLIF